MTCKRWCITGLTAALLVAGAVLPALAQQQTGSISGRASDASGATLPGVTVSIVSDN
jgi:hypothetical protein